MPTFHLQPNSPAIIHTMAEWLTTRALAKNGSFSLCLSGGSTPQALYRLLATPSFSTRFPWARTQLFFGDERFLPPTHADSNYRTVHETLLAHIPLPPTHVHPFPTNGTPAEAAARYTIMLQQHAGRTELDPATPLFDVTLLGLGEDGHTASLFPGQPALQERTAWAAAVIGAKPEPRLTLTYPALHSSHAVAFLVTGANKSSIFARVQAGDPTLPASHIQPEGELHWFADAAAAARCPTLVSAV